MTALSGHLVGRTEELGSLDQVLTELDRGQAAALELVGESGIGKTRLLRELATRAASGGRLVLAGSASETERDLPFAVFVDALDDYLRGLESGRFDRIDEDMQTELAHVFPGLSVRAAGSVAAAQHERYRAHRAVRALLETLAETRPLVLVLDDLHWADSASVELLGALLRRPPSAAVLLAFARRPRPVPEGLAALGRPHRPAVLTRIDLGALSPGEARELLGETVDVATATALYQETGGNPFYLEQLIRSLHPATAPAIVSSISPAQLGVPVAVVASLEEELALLAQDGRHVLEAAAVAGDPFDPELAAAAAAMPEPAVIEVVDQLLDLELIRTTDVPRRFRFRHPLVRRAVYEATPAGWRLGAHERCAEALIARGAAAAACAHHVALSAREGDLDAVARLREAGESSLRLAPASSARWFADALRVLPQTAPTEQRVDLLQARAGALTACGHFAESHRSLLEALAIVPATEQTLRARLVRACAAVESNLGHHAQASARLEGALRQLKDPAPPEAVALMIELALSEGYRTHYLAMQDWAKRSVDAARALEDPPLLAAAVAMLAFAYATTGVVDDAASNRREAAAMVDALSDDELVRRLDAVAWLAGAELYLDRYTDADVHADRGLAVARATGQGELFLVLVQLLTRAWTVRGKLVDARELLDSGIEAARLLGNTQALVWNLFNRSIVLVAMGDVETAVVTAQESFDLSLQLDSGFLSAWAAVRLAGALVEVGQPARAVELIRDHAGGEDLGLIPGSWRAYAFDLATHCWLSLGRGEEAQHTAARARAWASATQLPLASVWADRASAAVQLYHDNPARAAEQALTSAIAAEEVGASIEAALSRTLAGRALAQAERVDEGIAQLERAAAALDGCGALRFRDHAEHELRKLGRPLHRRTLPGRVGGTGVEALTERELQVARLVVDRKTNREIAARLYLSVKTVETHLRNIFRKLGVSSRVELARVVERADRQARPDPH